MKSDKCRVEQINGEFKCVTPKADCPKKRCRGFFTKNCLEK
jgi:hypothetical protein